MQPQRSQPLGEARAPWNTSMATRLFTEQQGRAEGKDLYWAPAPQGAFPNPGNQEEALS